MSFRLTDATASLHACEREGESAISQADSGHALGRWPCVNDYLMPRRIAHPTLDRNLHHRVALEDSYSDQREHNFKPSSMIGPMLAARGGELGGQ
jgi:hypothetical protein